MDVKTRAAKSAAWEEEMDKKAHRRYGFTFLLLGTLLVCLLVWNINSGSVKLSVNDIFHILFFHEGDETAYNIIWEIRIPRILA